ncbi:UNKNOWN [Stylonychia lemnae]|uniref:Uncharacterized protein n=1 Tax=Stylonychia lemnae TaxID=5949 RepID=A0A078AMM6_STYLE|nr:UNKNOWN [Stylonychia lemnae]|eukprot:CDW83409.1 UNKNOWN [Stylonychia lemnae]
MQPQVKTVNSNRSTSNISSFNDDRTLANSRSNLNISSISSQFVNNQRRPGFFQKSPPTTRDLMKKCLLSDRVLDNAERRLSSAVSPTYKSQIKFQLDLSSKENVEPRQKSIRRQSPYARRESMGGLIHDYQMKVTKNVTGKLNQAAPSKVMNFMKENNYHPYYVTQEHCKLITIIENCYR